jgi:anti-sigma B factor antagonist
MPEPATAGPLALEIVRTDNDVMIRCRGKIVAGVNDYLYTEVSRQIPGAKRIVLDLTELTHMDSMGLGAIVRLYVSARSTGCQVQLINLGPRIQKLLGVTNLLTIFTTIGQTGISYL